MFEAFIYYQLAVQSKTKEKISSFHFYQTLYTFKKIIFKLIPPGLQVALLRPRGLKTRRRVERIQDGAARVAVSDTV